MPIPKDLKDIDYNPINKSYLIYGDPKIGKTTLASRFETELGAKCLFFCTEDGHKFVKTRNWQSASGAQPQNWNNFLECLNEFVNSDCKLLVVDTVAHLVNWCAIHILGKLEIEDESEGNYGDAYRRIDREFYRVINKIGQIGKGIIFIAHVKYQKKSTDIIYPDLPEKYENLFNGMVDYIFYYHNTFDGKRHIRTKGTPSIIAGDRSGVLPNIIPMDDNLFFKLLSNKKEIKNYAPGAEGSI